MAEIIVRDDDNAVGRYALLAYVRSIREDAYLTDDGSIVVPSHSRPVVRAVSLPDGVGRLTAIERDAINVGVSLAEVMAAEDVVRRVHAAAREQAAAYAAKRALDPGAVRRARRAL